MLHVRRIAVNLATEAIEDIYYAELEDPIEGLNGVEIQDLINNIRDRYCHINQADLDANLDHFHQGIDPSLPLIVYIRKEEDCQEFAHDGHVDIFEATMVTTGTKHALQCGAFTDTWKEWNRFARANQTWANWKTHWTRAFEEQKTTTHPRWRILRTLNHPIKGRQTCKPHCHVTRQPCHGGRSKERNHGKTHRDEQPQRQNHRQSHVQTRNQESQHNNIAQHYQQGWTKTMRLI
jgi:hypothetical protein